MLNCTELLHASNSDNTFTLSENFTKAKAQKKKKNHKYRNYILTFFLFFEKKKKKIAFFLSQKIFSNSSNCYIGFFLF